MKQLRDSMFVVRASTLALLSVAVIGTLAAYQVPGSAATGVPRPAFDVRFAPAALLPDSQEIGYDDGRVHTWWCSDKDSFGAAVRFTPREYPCEVIGGRAPIHYMDGANIYVRVFAADGPGHHPGTLLAEKPCANVPHNADSSFKEYDLESPVTVDSGDFYVCFWQKAYFNLVFASDLRMDSASRQLWFLPPGGWVAPSGLDAADHLIRAAVNYPGTGIVEEVSGQRLVIRSPQFAIEPNPCRGRFSARVAQTATPWRLEVRDASGRLVRNPAVSQSAVSGSQLIDLRGLRDGLYFVRLESGRFSSTRKLILQK